MTKVKFGDVKGFKLVYNFLVKYDGIAKEHSWNAINAPDTCMSVSKLHNGTEQNRTAQHIIFLKEMNMNQTLVI